MVKAHFHHAQVFIFLNSLLRLVAGPSLKRLALLLVQRKIVYIDQK